MCAMNSEEKMSIETWNKPVSQNIKRLLSERGVKQKSVALKAGLSVRVFSAMLNGRRIIKPCDVLVIAETLGVEPNDLYGIKDPG